ncbi:MAG: argininosuccinate lyase [Candidatus Dormibacteraeota bacterium]|nr:argininosuccinate lyase [Candidatus Dormibacteraeota bacterium]
MSRQTGKLYSGRFEEGLLPELERFSSSLQQDLRLAPFDVRGSLAHARGLHAAGILNQEDLSAIEQGLRQVGAELDSGSFAFLETDEDIHTAVERRLTELAPDAGPRLHAGRSRNDQVALDLRLWCRAACASLTNDLAGLIEALADQALRNARVPMPGYTHLQRAQPVTAGYHLLAHAEPLLRDAERVRHAYEAADRMPLGSGALAGSTLPLPRELVAEELGFGALTENTMDAVSDRDFELDLLYACTTIAIHLSRLGEDVVLWASAEFGFVRLPDRIATGSSIMPQKKNPDIAELIRGRSGRAIGSLTALAAVLKGLPLTYDRDLQEDKVALFAAVDNALDCLRAARLLVLNLEFDRERLSRGLDDPGLLATDRAEQLVAEGVPFREAHHRVAAEVRGGRQRAPWSAERSLELRRLDPAGRAQKLRRQSAGMRRWADQHPPRIPGPGQRR